MEAKGDIQQSRIQKLKMQTCEKECHQKTAAQGSYPGERAPPGFPAEVSKGHNWREYGAQV
jgi:hypothetical protein